MPPRYSYWTIIAGGLPTAFRAADREDLLPTFNRIQEKHPDAEMKWFARGKLWESPESARADTERRRRLPEGTRTGTGGTGVGGTAPGSRRPSGLPEGERRGRDWRPGGEHRDPRQRFKDAKKEQNQERRQERFDRKQGLAAPKPRSGGDEPNGPANRLRQGYGGPPKLPAKAEAGHDVHRQRPAPPKPRSGEDGPRARDRHTAPKGPTNRFRQGYSGAPKRRSRGGGH